MSLFDEAKSLKMNLNLYKKEWYKAHHKEIRARENSEPYKEYRNLRVLLKKLVRKLQNTKLTPKCYEVLEQAYFLSKILPLFKENIEKIKKYSGGVVK